MNHSQAPLGVPVFRKDQSRRGALRCFLPSDCPPRGLEVGRPNGLNRETPGIDDFGALCEGQ
jgi:hypothetical protein